MTGILIEQYKHRNANKQADVKQETCWTLGLEEDKGGEEFISCG